MSSMIKHFPALVIVIPLLAATSIPIAIRINRALSWYITFLTTLVCFLISLSLLHTVLKSGKISYWMGGWPPPFGIEYVIDYFSIFVLLLVTFVVFMNAIYSKKSIEMEIARERVPIFYAVYLLFVTGLMGMVVTGDIFNAYVFLEITSIAGYALIAIGKDKKALLASFNYLIIGTIGATFFLLGIGYLYLVTGTLNMADMAERLAGLYNSKAVLTAFTLFTIGFGIKAALFPLHLWQPNAYTYAPTAVSSLMAPIATKVAAYVFFRILFSVFKPAFLTAGPSQIMHLFVFLSAVAVLAGSILALAQKDIRKMLAYSSVGQIGYIFLGISLMNLTGIVGSLLHILNHALMKGSLFLVVGVVIYKTGITTIDNFKGMGKKMPVAMAAFTIAALSMIGVPLTAGFVSKWYLSVASIEIGMWYLVPVILISSLLTAIYFWRIIDNIYLKGEMEEKSDHDPAVNQVGNLRRVPALMMAPTVIMAVLCIVFGVFSNTSVSLAERAAMSLLR